MFFKGEKKDWSPHSPLKTDDHSGASLDWEKLNFPLKVRNRHEGDRYRPLGSPGRKKLKEIMRAKEIPHSLRDRNPVFLSGDEIVWVLGLPVAEKFKVTDNTREIFTITPILK